MRVLAAILAVVAGATAVGGAGAWSLRDGVVERRGFVDGAMQALDRPPVRAAIDTEITAQVLARVPESVVSTDQVRAVVERATGTRAFRRAYRRGARDVHAALFSEQGTATLRVDIADVVPQLAPLLSGGASADLATVDRGNLPTGIHRAADVVRGAAIGLPVLAAVALAAALLLARSRRSVLAGAGLTAVVCGALLLAGLGLARSSLLDAASARDGLSRAQARDAAGAVWDVYAGGLHTIGIVAIAVGAVVAAAALLTPGRRGRP